jgi:hypothetical protein
MPKPNPLSQGLEGQAQKRRKAKAAAPPAAAATRNVTRVLVAGHFQPEVQRTLRIMAAEEGTTVQALLAEALNMLFAKHHKPKIAAAKGR